MTSRKITADDSRLANDSYIGNVIFRQFSDNKKTPSKYPSTKLMINIQNFISQAFASSDFVDQSAEASWRRIGGHFKLTDPGRIHHLLFLH